MSQTTVENSKVQEVSEQQNPKLFRATVLLIMSAFMLVFTVIVLKSMGIHHVIAGMFISDGVVKTGVISQDGQITSMPGNKILYRMNKNIVFDNAWVRGSIQLENPEAGKYDLEFSFYMPSNKQKPIYVSPLLKPGECILSDKLDEHPNKGSYSCICIVKAYDSDGSVVGTFDDSVRITITSY